ncbi:MAG: DUF58 domain-containing protein [Granulosicoccus sp.]|nr:DUF58 domain-containing protein [Granulosicoccus sp.]
MNTTHDRLLKPEVLARLGNLELIARSVVDGLLTGLHRSPNFGFSQEFAEYRSYNEGDDLRFIDWNVYARTDRTYIKRFRGETNSTVTLLLDASASMAFGEPISKLEQAKYLMAAMAYLVRLQHDALSITVFNDELRDTVPPTSKPDSLHRVLAVLERLEAGRGTELVESLSTFRSLTNKRGLVFLVSDFYSDAESISTALQPLVYGGQDVAICHVLDPEERAPSIKTISALQDMETDVETMVDPSYMREGYRDAIQTHCEQLQDVCRRMGVDYIALSTQDPLDEVLHQYLQFRARRER